MACQGNAGRSLTFVRPNFLLKAVVLFVVVYSTFDFLQQIPKEWHAGWDFMTNCDAAGAYLAGKNPYLVESFQFSRNVYDYAPATLPITAGFCKALGIRDVHKVYVYFPAYWAIIALVLLWSARIAGAKELATLFYATSLTALAGVPWLLRTGNFTIFEFAFLAPALAFLMRALSDARRTFDPWIFAVLFGLFCAVKTAPAIFILLFVLLPFARSRRLQLMAVAFAIVAVPLLVSLLRYPQYLPFQAHVVLADQLLCNPSVFCMVWNTLGQSGLVMDVTQFFKAIAGTSRGIAVQADVARTAIAAAIAYSIVYGGIAVGLGLYLLRIGFPMRLKSWGPDRAYRAFLLGIFAGMSLLLPRLKEYSFALEAALIAFTLLARRKLDLTAIAVLVVAALPLITDHPRIGVESLFGRYSQLLCSLAVLAILAADLLHDFRAAEETAGAGLKPAGARAASAAAGDG